MMTRYLLPIIISIFLPAASRGHEDTIIKVSDGKLIGLPSEYEPALFSYETRKLTIGTNYVLIPENIWEHVKPNEVTASWYHDNFACGLPPYLHLVNSSQPMGPCLVINLNTLELIEAYCRGIPAECLDQWKVIKRTVPNHNLQPTPLNSGVETNAQGGAAEL